VDEVRGMLQEGEITVEELTDGVEGVEAPTPDADVDTGTDTATAADADTGALGRTRIGASELEPRPRPDTISGVTQKIETGYGGLYVTINEDDEGIFEVFAQIGKSGGYTTSFTEGIARLASLCLRSGIPPEQVVEQLEGIRSPKVTFDRGEQIHSVPDAMAKAMQRYMEGNIDAQQSRLPTSVEEENETAETKEAESDGGVATQSASDVERIVNEGMNPECPECDSMLVYTEGCVKCKDCGYSEC
ncbi:MAG: TSCPD domain-containing protein, partial [Halobacteria archaeon]|nr:TSCPD domain-containing protein [Halobacteria archaeon]